MDKVFLNAELYKRLIKKTLRLCRQTD